MSSNIKKSLYLGLAALTFASVAGASTASVTNVNAAAKHHSVKVTKKHAKKSVKKHAKKAPKALTFKTTKKSLDQSIVLKSTGQSAVYSKPAGVKGAKIVDTQASMEAKSNSSSSSNFFMAYQEATTSKGEKYYKVVSFNKKVRGYVKENGVTPTQSYTDVSSKYNFNGTQVYLKNNRLFNNAYGTVFGTKRVNVNKANLGDAFNVDKAYTNSEGTTYFHVYDSNPSVGNLVSGWVYEGNLTKNSNDSLKNTSDFVKVNFVNNSGAVVANGNLTSLGEYNTTNNFSNVNNVYSTDKVQAAVNVLATETNSPLNGTSYAYTNDSNSTNYYGNMAAMSNVTKGATINIRVDQPVANQQVKVNFKTVDNNNNVGKDLNMNGAQSGSFNIDNSGLKGNSNQYFNLANVESNLFNQGQPLNVIKNSDGTFVFNGSYTNTNAGNPNLFNIFNGYTQKLYKDVPTINAYYTKVDSQQNQPVVPSAGVPTNTQANAGDIINK